MFSALKSIFSAPRTQGNHQSSTDEMVDIFIDERLISKRIEAKSSVLSPWAQGPSTPAEMAKAVIASSRSSFGVDKDADDSSSTNLLDDVAAPAKPKTPRKSPPKSKVASAKKPPKTTSKPVGSSPRPKRGLNTVGFPKGDWILPGSSGAPEISVNFQAEYSDHRPQSATV